MHPNAQDVATLRSIVSLSSLAPDILASRPGLVEVECAQEGNQLFEQGDQATAFFVVLSGWVLLLRLDEKGNRTAVKLIGPGQSFAEAMLPEGSRYPVNAEIVTDARLARISTEVYRKQLTEDPALAISIVAATFSQLRGLVDRIEQREGWSPPRRVAAFLLKYVRAGEASAEFQLPVEQRLIAETLSMSPSTFSRTLSALESLGVSANRGHITVKNAAALRREAEGQILTGERT